LSSIRGSSLSSKHGPRTDKPTEAKSNLQQSTMQLHLLPKLVTEMGSVNAVVDNDFEDGAPQDVGGPPYQNPFH
jgi:hypothetical protein